MYLIFPWEESDTLGFDSEWVFYKGQRLLGAPVLGARPVDMVSQDTFQKMQRNMLKKEG
jgi:hypothetical protein